ncbi:MAG: carbon-nitrogen hydrolase family protein [Betaproteobacteria bacterium]|nr:MAG: carbon-nitrogen hydrolase family protein [Betaproteobacteria bacterium]TMH02760.1 MAG: carbon-nitrogen hydrolase family protein [Betaproteobacteria bacterium]
MSRIAVIQKAPSLLDRERTMRDAVDAVDEASRSGAELVVFPETFIPGYPVWIWRLRPGTDAAIIAKLHSRLVSNAVDVSRGDLTPLCEAAKRNKVSVVCGIDERDHDTSRGTLYNAVVLVGTDGAIIAKHRKLMPTNVERTVWGFGDGSSVNVVDTPCGRVGVLICWESYMPLARFALYAQGIELYIAPTYDSGDDWIGTLQHIAREGCCWVIGSGTVLRASDLPADFPSRDALYPDADEWINDGDSVVVAPGGKIVAGPMRRETGILYADVSIDAVVAAKRRIDVAGHYARPDVFQLHVNRQRQAPVTFD